MWYVVGFRKGGSHGDAESGGGQERPLQWQTGRRRQAAEMPGLGESRQVLFTTWELLRADEQGPYRRGRRPDCVIWPSGPAVTSRSDEPSHLLIRVC